MANLFRFARFAVTSLYVLLSLLLPAFTGGCAQGVPWRGFTFDPVYNEAKRDHKLTFVYFRHWSVIACTNFEENVLKSQAVLDALRPSGPFYCVVLDAYVDRAIAREWGVTEVPGVVILEPEGRILSILTKEISTEQLLAALQSAVASYPTASQPHQTQ